MILSPVFLYIQPHSLGCHSLDGVTRGSLPLPSDDTDSATTAPEFMILWQDRNANITILTLWLLLLYELISQQKL